MVEVEFDVVSDMTSSMLFRFKGVSAIGTSASSTFSGSSTLDRSLKKEVDWNIRKDR